MTIADEIERYLRTGEYDPSFSAWPGDVIERAGRGHGELCRALLREIRQRVNGLPVPPEVNALDTVSFTRRKVEPMVRGLFPRVEQDAVLGVLERSVVFLTPMTIEQVLLGQRWPGSAWHLANLYLASVGSRPLAEGALSIVGLSEETTCFISPAYFQEEDPFADFVVHEVAHIFHNCKRRTVGLSETRRREWLLDIEYRRRETFAYCCEAYARIVARARSRPERMALGSEYGSEARISDQRVDPAELADIVREAAAARNGWKRILARCAPAKSSGADRREVPSPVVPGVVRVSRE